MRYFVIASATDTLVGLRLAGVEGVEAHDRDQALAALNRALERKDIGILLVSESLAQLCQDVLEPLKLSCRTPLVVEIPDRTSGGRSSDSIARYINEVLGIKL